MFGICLIGSLKEGKQELMLAFDQEPSLREIHGLRFHLNSLFPLDRTSVFI